MSVSSSSTTSSSMATPMTTMISSTVKVKLGDDIRRIIVEDFSSLRNAVMAQYNIDVNTHRPSFHYTDDEGDQCAIVNDDGLKAALASIPQPLADGARAKILAIMVTSTPISLSSSVSSPASSISSLSSLVSLSSSQSSARSSSTSQSSSTASGTLSPSASPSTTPRGTIHESPRGSGTSISSLDSITTTTITHGPIMHGHGHGHVHGHGYAPSAYHHPQHHQQYQQHMQHGGTAHYTQGHTMIHSGHGGHVHGQGYNYQLQTRSPSPPNLPLPLPSSARPLSPEPATSAHVPNGNNTSNNNPSGISLVRVLSPPQVSSPTISPRGTSNDGAFAPSSSSPLPLPSASLPGTSSPISSGMASSPSSLSQAPPASASATAAVTGGSSGVNNGIGIGTRAEVVVFWDFENVPMKPEYSAQTTVNAIRAFTDKLANNSNIEVFFNQNEPAYARGNELSALMHVHVHGVYVPVDRAKKKRVNAADRQMGRYMYDQLFRVPRYTHVVVITGDADYLAHFAQLSADNRSRRWVLIRNKQARSEFVTNSLWSQTMLFDELFVGMMADRVAPRTLKLARKGTDANGIPLAVSPPPGSGTTSSSASPSQSPPHTSPLHGARSILDAPAIPPSAFMLDRPPSIGHHNNNNNTNNNNNSNSNSGTPTNSSGNPMSNRMTKKEEAEHRRLTKLRKDLDKLGLDVIASSPIVTSNAPVSTTPSSASSASLHQPMSHSSSANHLPIIPPYSSSSSTLDFGPRAISSAPSSYSGHHHHHHTQHAHHTSGVHGHGHGGMHGSGSSDDLGWEPADHDHADEMVEDSFTLEDEGSSSDSEPMRHILSEVAAQNLLGRSRHDSSIATPTTLPANHGHNGNNNNNTNDINATNGMTRQRSGSGAGLTPTLLSQAQWPAPVSFTTSSSTATVASSRGQRPSSAPPSATGFRHGHGHGSGANGVSASPQAGSSGVSSPVMFEGSDRSRQLVATHSRSSSIPDGNTVLPHTSSHGMTTHTPHGHIHHGHHITATPIGHTNGSSGVTGTGHGNLTPTAIANNNNGGMVPNSSASSHPISPSHHIPHHLLHNPSMGNTSSSSSSSSPSSIPTNSAVMMMVTGAPTNVITSANVSSPPPSSLLGQRAPSAFPSVASSTSPVTICSYFLQGKCRFQSGCRNLHIFPSAGMDSSLYARPSSSSSSRVIVSSGTGSGNGSVVSLSSSSSSTMTAMQSNAPVPMASPTAVRAASRAPSNVASANHSPSVTVTSSPSPSQHSSSSSLSSHHMSSTGSPPNHIHGQGQSHGHGHTNTPPVPVPATNGNGNNGNNNGNAMTMTIMSSSAAAAASSFSYFSAGSPSFNAPTSSPPSSSTSGNATATATTTTTTGPSTTSSSVPTAGHGHGVAASSSPSPSLCVYYSKNGRCRNGSTCAFTHAPL